MSRGLRPDGRGGPHVFVTGIDSPVLADDDRHHLDRVLRLREGEPCTVGDGRGSWRRCRFGAELEITGPVISVEAPAPVLTVGFALLKGSRPDLVVQKLTELGVDRIVPFLSDRSIVRWDTAKRRDHHHRWVRVAREAAMQSRQVWLPAVEPVAEFAEVAAAPGVHLADLGADPVGPEVTTVLIGPEGGWTDGERADLPVVGLGGSVLRAETAALAAGVRLTAWREARATSAESHRTA